jgi:hypothetical protein
LVSVLGGSAHAQRTRARVLAAPVAYALANSARAGRCRGSLASPRKASARTAPAVLRGNARYAAKRWPGRPRRIPSRDGRVYAGRSDIGLPGGWRVIYGSLMRDTRRAARRLTRRFRRRAAWPVDSRRRAAVGGPTPERQVVRRT